MNAPNIRDKRDTSELFFVFPQELCQSFLPPPHPGPSPTRRRTSASSSGRRWSRFALVTSTTRTSARALIRSSPGAPRCAIVATQGVAAVVSRVEKQPFLLEVQKKCSYLAA